VGSTGNSQVNFWSKSWKEKLIVVAISAMAIGQWSDTKAILEESYIGIVSNFTHTYEYESLNKINVGANLAYIEQTLGSPQLIKKSNFVDELQFNYYLHEKYILTLIHKNERILGYSILSLVDDFIPNNLITKDKTKDKHTVFQFYTSLSDFTLDYNNIDFILVQEELDKSKLFLNQFSGSVGYFDYLNLKSSELKTLYNELNNDDSIVDMSADIQKITSKTINNFYGIGEFDLAIMADSILTRFEYYLYYH